MRISNFIAVLAAVLGLSVASLASAQTLLSEDFTQATTSNNNGVGNWLFSNGACLTAGTGTTTTNPAATVPGCVSMSAYYGVAGLNGVSQKTADAYLVGGSQGYLGGTSAPSSISSETPDAVGSGALRFTNGSQNGSYGYGERGSILSSQAYPASNGVQVTFKTVTYHGNSGGNGQSTPYGASEGADGMSFFIVDGCMPVAGGTMPSGCTTNNIYTGNGYQSTFQPVGGTGGSLAYSCSNNNTPYDGLVGAYIGVGIDEYGNFLNGSSSTLSTTSNSGINPNGTNKGDNTASGGYQYANRIGIRGAGSISWQALTNAYGTNPNNSAAPYYPLSLYYSCASVAGQGTPVYDQSQLNSAGTYGACESCPVNTGTVAYAYNMYQGTCTATTTNTTYLTTCNTANSAAASGDTYTYNGNLAQGFQCVECPNTATYSSTTSTQYRYGSCQTQVYATSTVTENAPTCPGSGYTYQPTGTNAGMCTGGSTTSTESANACTSGTLTTTPPGHYCITSQSGTYVDSTTRSGSSTTYTYGYWKNGNTYTAATEASPATPSCPGSGYTYQATGTYAGQCTKTSTAPESPNSCGTNYTLTSTPSGSYCVAACASGYTYQDSNSYNGVPIYAFAQP